MPGSNAMPGEGDGPLNEGWLDNACSVGYNNTCLVVEGVMSAIKERRGATKKSGNGHVVLSRKRYDRLMEDLHDLAVVAERRDEPSIGFDEMTKRLRKRGLL
jgi:hypothetical protein